MHHPFFTYSATDGHQGWSHVLDMVNANATIINQVMKMLLPQASLRSLMPASRSSKVGKDDSFCFG